MTAEYAQPQDADLVSVVVIGLNEQEQLEASLKAVFDCRPSRYRIEVLYVDSGSTDRSVAIASGIEGVQVLHLPDSRRSAARARNVGLRNARGRFVQLVDGDSVIQPGWMDAALAVLEQEPLVACVFGQCVEMRPEQSLYMKVCGLDWHIPTGNYRFCGGNSLWRMSVIAKHGYFDERIRVGEEPELCYRVRSSGSLIRCIDIPMVKHDLAMQTFGEYWRRAVDSGRAYAVIARRFWRNPEKLWLREAVLTFAEPVSWVLVFVLGWYFLDLIGGAAFLATWWLARAAQIAYRMRSRNLSIPDALLYGFHCQFARLPASIGELAAVIHF